MTSALPAARASPAGVGAIPRPDLSKRTSPVSRWRAVMCWLTALGL